MAERYTTKDAQRAFEQLCKVMGKRIAGSGDVPAYKDAGAWYLDTNFVYGGHVVSEILASGGVTMPMGYLRRSNREFCNTVYFLTEALRGKIVSDEAKSEAA